MVRFVAEVVPLTHVVRLVRAACTSRYDVHLLGDPAYIAVFIVAVGALAVRRLRRRLVS